MARETSCPALRRADPCRIGSIASITLVLLVVVTMTACGTSESGSAACQTFAEVEDIEADTVECPPPGDEHVDDGDRDVSACIELLRSIAEASSWAATPAGDDPCEWSAPIAPGASTAIVMPPDYVADADQVAAGAETIGMVAYVSGPDPTDPRHACSVVQREMDQEVTLTVRCDMANPDWDPDPGSSPDSPSS